MYREHFNLTDAPFTNNTDPRFFFRTPEYEEALAVLLYGVMHQRGITLITGVPGSGKTMLARMFVQSLDTRVDAAMILHTPDTGHDLVAALCRGLGVRYRGSHSTAELIERLEAQLIVRLNEGRLVAAIIDESQRLSPEVLEHVRLLANLEQGANRLLQVVLLGQPEIEETLRDSRLGQFRQRIACSCRLKPLERDQTRSYIRHRLQQAGAEDAGLVTDEAIDLIHDRSGGLPRMINQIMDNALLSAYSAGQTSISRELVADCITELMALQLAEASDRGRGSTPAEAVMESTPARADESPPGPPLASLLSEAVRRGWEVAGRLDEVTRNADRQVRDLSGLLARTSDTVRDAEHSRQALETTQHESVTRRDDLVAAVSAAEQAVGRIAESREKVHKWQRDTAGRFRSVHRHFRQLREKAEEVQARSAGAAEALHGAIERASALLDELNTREAAASRGIRDAAQRAEQVAGRLDAESRRGEEQSAHLDRLVTDADRREAGLGRLIEQTHESIRRIEGAMDQAAGVTREMDDQLASMAVEIRRHQDEVDRIGALLTEREDRARMQTLRLDELIAACEGHAGALKDMGARAEEHLGRIRQAIDQITALNQEVRSCVTRAERDLAAQIELAETTRASLGEDTRRAGQHGDELKALIRDAEERTARTKDVLVHVDGRVTEVHEVIGRAADAAGDLEYRITRISTRVADELAEANATCSRLNEQRDASEARLNDSFARAQRVIQQMEERGSEVVREVDEQARHAASATAALRDENEKAATHAERLGTITEEAGRGTATLEEAMERSRRHTAHVEEAAERAVDLADQLDARVDAFTGELTEHGAAAQVRCTELREASRRALEEAARLEGLLERAGQGAGALHELDRQSRESLKQINEAVGDANALANRLTGQVEALSGDVAARVKHARAVSDELHERDRQAAERATHLNEALLRAERDASNLDQLAARAREHLVQLDKARTDGAQVVEAIDERMRSAVTVVGEQTSRAREIASLIDHKQDEVRESLAHLDEHATSAREQAGRLQDLLAAGNGCADTLRAASEQVTSLSASCDQQRGELGEMLSQAVNQNGLMSATVERAVSVREQLEQDTGEVRRLWDRVAACRDDIEERLGSGHALADELSRREDVLAEHLREAEQASSRLGAIVEESTSRAQDWTERAHALTRQLERSDQAARLMDEHVHSAQTIRENLGRQLAAFQQARRHADAAADRLAHERAEAEAAADRLLDLRGDVQGIVQESLAALRQGTPIDPKERAARLARIVERTSRAVQEVCLPADDEAAASSMSLDLQPAGLREDEDSA